MVFYRLLIQMPLIAINAIEMAVDADAITALLPNFVPSATLKPAAYELKISPITMIAAEPVKLCIPVVLLKLVKVNSAMQAKSRDRPTALNASPKLTSLPETNFVDIFTTQSTDAKRTRNVIVVFMGAIAAKKINAAVNKR